MFTGSFHLEWITHWDCLFCSDFTQNHTHSLNSHLDIVDFSVPHLFVQPRKILLHTCVMVTLRSLLGAMPHFNSLTAQLTFTFLKNSKIKKLFRHSRASNKFKMLYNYFWVIPWRLKLKFKTRRKFEIQFKMTGLRLY